MLSFILIALAVIVMALIAFVALQPSQFRIARTATIAAPAPVVFGLVNDFHERGAWSPYEKLDPAMKKTFEGAGAGKGAIYSWSGNNQAGVGRSTITESRPHELIRIKLEFMKPFEVTNTAEFAFKPQGNETAVTWSLSGTRGFLFKAVGLLMNMDRMVGGQFEEGLAQLNMAAASAR